MGWKTNFSLALMSSAAIAITPGAGSAMTFTEAADLPDIWPPQTLAVGTTRVEGWLNGPTDMVDMFILPQTAATPSPGIDVVISVGIIAAELEFFVLNVNQDLNDPGSLFSSAPGEQSTSVIPDTPGVLKVGSMTYTMFEDGNNLGFRISSEGANAFYCIDVSGDANACSDFTGLTQTSEPAAAALMGAALVGVGAASRRRAKRR